MVRTAAAAQHPLALARAGCRPHRVAARAAGLGALLSVYSCRRFWLPFAEQVLRRGVEEHTAQRHGAPVHPEAQHLGAAAQGRLGRGAHSLEGQRAHCASALQPRWL